MAAAQSAETVTEEEIHEGGPTTPSKKKKNDAKKEDDMLIKHQSLADNDADVKKAATRMLEQPPTSSTSTASISKSKKREVTTSTTPGGSSRSTANLKDGSLSKSTLSMAPAVHTSSAEVWSASRRNDSASSSASRVSLPPPKDAKSQRLSFAPTRLPSLVPSPDDERGSKRGASKAGGASAPEQSDNGAEAPGAFSIHNAGTLERSLVIDEEEQQNPHEILTAELVDQEAIEEQIIHRKSAEIRAQIIQNAPKATKVEVDEEAKSEEASCFVKNKCCLLALVLCTIVAVVLAVVLSSDKNGPSVVNGGEKNGPTMAPATSI
jgi:hypothetical protein